MKSIWLLCSSKCFCPHMTTELNLNAVFSCYWDDLKLLCLVNLFNAALAVTRQKIFQKGGSLRRLGKGKQRCRLSLTWISGFDCIVNLQVFWLRMGKWDYLNSFSYTQFLRAYNLSSQELAKPIIVALLLVAVQISPLLHFICLLSSTFATWIITSQLWG